MTLPSLEILAPDLLRVSTLRWAASIACTMLLTFLTYGSLF